MLIETPQALCTKCNVTVPIVVQTLHRAVGANQRSLCSLVDDAGVTWLVLNAERPAGWIAGPAGGTDPRLGLCFACGTAWTASIQEFMATQAPAPTVPELAVKPPEVEPVVEEPVAAALTVAAGARVVAKRIEQSAPIRPSCTNQPSMSVRPAVQHAPKSYAPIMAKVETSQSLILAGMPPSSRQPKVMQQTTVVPAKTLPLTNSLGVAAPTLFQKSMPAPQAAVPVALPSVPLEEAEPAKTSPVVQRSEIARIF